ncbi:MAG: hypothetical protein LUF27_08195, partial [Lachnospiraceae bacterium]|nr:hypothetical protein [Lachnospiraceae bacterium]
MGIEVEDKVKIRLRGGIFFALLWESRHGNWGSDSEKYTQYQMCIDLAKIVKPDLDVEKNSGDRNNLTTTVNNYKSCKNEGGLYFPLYDNRKTIKDRIKNEYAKVLNEMHGFY